jgi:hypothetical protein
MVTESMQVVASSQHSVSPDNTGWFAVGYGRQIPRCKSGVVVFIALFFF